MAEPAPEEAIRAYLMALRDDLQPDDPLEALLRRALEHAFVEHAAAWAAARGIGPEAFMAEGVSSEVLARAGIRVRTMTLAEESQAVRLAIPHRQPFTIEGLATRAGTSRRTAHQVVEQELRAGALRQVALSRVQGNGRRPDTLYQRVAPGSA
jgi:hypothetical protein